jgi:hypothetical protein
MTLLSYIGIAVIGLWLLYAGGLSNAVTIFVIASLVIVAIIAWVVYGIASTDGPRL